jgi:hypothetical protein
MTRKTLISKAQNADRLLLFRHPTDNAYVILAKKHESQGYQSRYQQVPVMYFIGLNFSEGFFTDHKLTGSNMARVEHQAREKLILEHDPDKAKRLVNTICNLQTYTAWARQRRLAKLRNSHY